MTDKKQLAEALKPCPFCGGEVKHHTDSAFHYGDSGYKQKSEDFTCECGLKLSIRGDEISKAEAFERFNTRALTPCENEGEEGEDGLDCGCTHPDRHRNPKINNSLSGGFYTSCNYCLRPRFKPSLEAAVKALEALKKPTKGEMIPPNPASWNAAIDACIEALSNAKGAAINGKRAG